MTKQKFEENILNKNDLDNISTLKYLSLLKDKRYLVLDQKRIYLVDGDFIIVNRKGEIFHTISGRIANKL